MEAHADKYSPAFSKEATVVKNKFGEKTKVSFADYEAGNYDSKDAWMYSSFWYKDFDGMAYKTMLRQLISKWGIMSTEMQQAFSSDMTFENADGSRNYVETEEDVIDIDPSEPVQSEQEQQNESEQVAEPAQDVASALFGNQ